MKILFMIYMALGLFTNEDIPLENRQPGTVPPADTATAGAKALLAAIEQNNPALAKDFFFHEVPFAILKNSYNPSRYHKKLTQWYAEDIATAHKRFKKPGWQFEKIELGRCKWKAPQTEGNNIAYWSCRRNFVTAKNGHQTRRFEIRVLINWGQSWYVTHLGPIHQ